MMLVVMIHGLVVVINLAASANPSDAVGFRAVCTAGCIDHFGPIGWGQVSAQVALFLHWSVLWDGTA